MSKYDPDYYQRNKDRELAKSKRWRLAHPESRKNTILKNRHNITLEDFKRMEKKQDGRCRICWRKVKLVVDHNHRTGKIRGLLCAKCNQGLGLFEENPLALEAAILYLDEWR